MTIFRKSKKGNFIAESHLHIPTPPPKRVQKIHQLLKQLTFWANKGDEYQEKKHWELIRYEIDKQIKQNDNN